MWTSEAIGLFLFFFFVGPLKHIAGIYKKKKKENMVYSTLVGPLIWYFVSNPFFACRFIAQTHFVAAPFCVDTADVVSTLTCRCSLRSGPIVSGKITREKSKTFVTDTFRTFILENRPLLIFLHKTHCVKFHLSTTFWGDLQKMLSETFR